jgi:hypothetical protein
MRKLSTHPQQDLDMLAHPQQSPQYRQFRAGYEHYLSVLPDLKEPSKYDLYSATILLQDLTARLTEESWIREGDPGDDGFSRTIIALEEEAKSELVVAKWGHGRTSPVHGHALGLIYEALLFGKLKVNTYRMTHPTSSYVRLVETRIISKPGEFAREYNPPNGEYYFQRPALIHNFQSIGFSASLHYLSEHVRDGRDNGFIVENFEDYWTITKTDVTRITSKQAMYLPKGEVVLVRSTNVPEYGDHYIVITGAPTIKEHGLRPQDVAIDAPRGHYLLNQYEEEMGLTLLKLNPDAKRQFHEFHGITMQNHEVIFPSSSPLKHHKL